MTNIDDSTQSAPSQGPKGIWGWNTIPMLNLVLIVIMCFRMALADGVPLFFNGSMWAMLTEGCEAYNPLLGVLISGECAYNLVLGTLCSYALILVARRSSTYPRLATILFWTSVIKELIDNVAANHIANYAITKDDITGIIRSFVFAVIWTSYFMQSARIKNTFINASANWRRIRNVLAWILGASLIVCYLGMQANNPFAEEEKESENATDVSGTKDTDDQDEYPPIGAELQYDEDGVYVTVTNKDPKKGYEVYLELGSEKNYFKVIPPGGQVEFRQGYWGEGSYGRLRVEGYDYVLSIYKKGDRYVTSYEPEEQGVVDDEECAPISATLDANNNLTVTNKDPNRGYDIRLELGAQSRRQAITPGGRVVFSDFKWHDGTMGKIFVPGYDSYLVVYSLGDKYLTRFEPKED